MVPRSEVPRATTPVATDNRATQMKLPFGVVTYSDVGLLRKEHEAIDEYLTQAAIRSPGSSQLPKYSLLYDEIASINNLNMLKPEDRKLLSMFLEVLYTKAPSIHISFSSDPSPLFLKRLITWVRQQMHPFVLLRIGLSPTIGAGCVVRTNNKYYDFSLRQHFHDQREMLITGIRKKPEVKTS